MSTPQARFLDVGCGLAGIQALANRFPAFYEAYLAFIFPARDLYFTLKVIK
jgi:hypothetical protein